MACAADTIQRAVTVRGRSMLILRVSRRAAHALMPIQIRSKRQILAAIFR